MYKFVVLFALLSVAISAPAPGLLGDYGGYALPAATSYSSRVDVHSKPIVTYSAPLVTKTLVAAHPVALPAISYGAVHSSPVIADYGYGLSHGYGLGGLDHGYGYGGYSHGW